jgi:large subunit ribosomal protein LP2
MRYVAAYLLANLGGNDSPSAKDIKNILESVGVDVDDEKLKKVVSELDGKDVNEVFILPPILSPSLISLP